MPRAKRVPVEGIKYEPPAMNPEDRYDQLIALAVDLAEERLRDKSASNQLVTEIIKYGSMRERLAREKLRQETEVLRVKAEAIEAAKRSEEMYEKAVKAMKVYQGLEEDEGYEEEY